MSTRAEILKEYADAVAKEKEGREHAFLDGIPFILKTAKGSISLRLMTLRDLSVLSNIGSEVIDDPIQAEGADVLRCLCYLDAHRPSGLIARTFRELWIARLPDAELRAGLLEYMDAAFTDCPPSQGRGSKPYYSWQASLVHTMASAYGWSRKEIMDTPIAAIFQLRKIQNAGGDAPMFNRSDSILNRLIS